VTAGEVAPVVELVGARHLDGRLIRARSRIPFKVNKVARCTWCTTRDSISQDVCLGQKVPVTTLADLDHIHLELAEGSRKFW
jgi:hypothetical protein